MRFDPSLEELGATYDNNINLIGKRLVDFLLVLIELFSLGVTAEALRAIIGSKSAISLQRGPVDLKFQVKRVAWSFGGNEIWTVFFRLLQSTRLIDRQTD